MTGPTPDVAEVRVAVRSALAHVRAEVPAPQVPLILVAVSGGADSLALAAATAFEAPRSGCRSGAVIVDHGWHPQSADVAARAAAQCEQLGLDPVIVVRVDTTRGSGGPEQRARDARYAAMDQVVADLDACAVFLGHHLQDQAETVLGRLTRGSGVTALAGMRQRRGYYQRPLLGVKPRVLRAACEDQGISWYEDPSNTDRTLLRSVVRHDVLPSLRKALGPRVDDALARTAQLCADDADYLAEQAQEALNHVRGCASPSGAIPVAELRRLPAALRRRVLQALVLKAGSETLSSTQLLAIDGLIVAGKGGMIDLPGGVRARISRGHLSVSRNASGGAAAQ